MSGTPLQGLAGNDRDLPGRASRRLPIEEPSVLAFFHLLDQLVEGDALAGPAARGPALPGSGPARPPTMKVRPILSILTRSLQQLFGRSHEQRRCRVQRPATLGVGRRSSG